MGGLEDRLRRLEERYGEGSSQQSPELAERRAALREDLRRGWEKAEREAAAGDSRRLHALEDLERSMRERVESRRRENLEKGD
jgi:hypothetical protein